MLLVSNADIFMSKFILVNSVMLDQVVYKVQMRTQNVITRVDIFAQYFSYIIPGAEWTRRQRSMSTDAG